MIHWTTAVMFCFISGFAGFMVAAILAMARDERRMRHGNDE